MPRPSLSFPKREGLTTEDTRTVTEQIAAMDAQNAARPAESVSSPCGVCGVGTTSTNVVEQAMALDDYQAERRAERIAAGIGVPDLPVVKWAICEPCRLGIANMPAIEPRTQALCLAISENPTGLHQILAVGLPFWSKSLPIGYTREQVGTAWVKSPLLFWETPGATPESEPSSRRFMHVDTLEIHNARKALIALRSEPQRPPKGYAGCSVCRISELPPVGAKSPLGGWATENLNSREMAFCGPCHASAGKRLSLEPSVRQGLSLADMAMGEWADVEPFGGMAAEWSRGTDYAPERFSGVSAAKVRALVDARRPKPVVRPALPSIFGED